MKEYIFTIALIASVLLLTPSMYIGAKGTNVKSLHFGCMYPNGVDLVGYTAEKKVRDSLYVFYTFGIPSFAATGISYYRNYEGNGLSGTFGVGIGSVMYSSLAYQLKVGKMDFFKLGAGVTVSVLLSIIKSKSSKKGAQNGT